MIVNKAEEATFPTRCFLYQHYQQTLEFLDTGCLIVQNWTIMAKTVSLKYCVKLQLLRAIFLSTSHRIASQPRPLLVHLNGVVLHACRQLISRLDKAANQPHRVSLSEQYRNCLLFQFVHGIAHLLLLRRESSLRIH